MTKTKKTEVAKGESDKGDKMSGYRQIGIIPSDVDAIPSVQILQMCGKTNLEWLLTAVQNALQTDAETCQSCKDVGKGACKVTCHESHLITMQILQDYAANLEVAIDLAEDDFPLLPDLRTEDWLQTCDEIAAYSVCDCAGEKKRLERTIAINPTLVLGQDESGNQTLEVQFSINDPNCPEWTAHARSAFDLHSPYMMTSTEESFFGAHPDALLIWLSMCGNLYPEYSVYDDVKDIFVHTLTNLHESVAV